MNIDNLTLEDEVEPMVINDPICDTISQVLNNQNTSFDRSDQSEHIIRLYWPIRTQY